MKRFFILLILSLITAGCYVTLMDPEGYTYKNPHDYILYIDADPSVNWSGTINDTYISGRGRRGYTFDRLPSCWDVRKSSYDGLLRVYVTRRNYSTVRSNDQATYRAGYSLRGCYR
jgi:hypothetical protein